MLGLILGFRSDLGKEFTLKQCSVDLILLRKMSARIIQYSDDGSDCTKVDLPIIAQVFPG